MKFQRHLQLPTKYVPSPKRLLDTMTKTAGEGNFHVEMRHNTYCISHNDESLNVKDIYISYHS
ncbi:hypothetical protein FB567DRAFT_519109 [Paraphoma chrysanthemicola]|uniref:Uncharacterized protein n=1 Tax=Paraphoma chrysanthemicola TaxID=798071 RepID=A0A8K0RFR4_9PLEO|nr:hypothetical protein FB567DRAFT_519109 [Paraphoma chrysanthemicola]